MGLTWIDHDIIEVPVEDVEVGTMVATDLNLTVETLRPKDETDAGLTKKVRRKSSLES